MFPPAHTCYATGTVQVPTAIHDDVSNMNEHMAGGAWPHIASLCLLASVFMHVALHHGGRCCMVLFTRNSLGWRNWFSFHHVYCSLHHGRFGLYYYEQYQLLYSLSCRMTSNAGLFFQFSGYNANVPVHALGPPTAVRLQNTGRFE
jgi:hypothetical protein